MLSNLLPGELGNWRTPFSQDASSSFEFQKVLSRAENPAGVLFAVNLSRLTASRIADI
jgi:hypothetical protein